jgi:hypothetical protein
LFIAPGFVVRIHRGAIPAAKHKTPSSGQFAGDPLFRKLFSANLPSIAGRSFDADQFGGDFSGEDSRVDDGLQAFWVA